MQELDHQAEVARARARVALAAYEAKSDIEWDMRFLTPLDKSWRGDAFAAAWAIPVIGLLIPYTRPWALEFFSALKAIHPSAPLVYLGGWSTIVTAIYGVRSVSGMFSGGVGGMVSAMGATQDLIPDRAVDSLASNANAVPIDPG